MPTFITLASWTDQGIHNFKDTASRAEAASDLAKRMGGEMKQLYWTLGQYDIVAVSEFPDDETGTAFLLALSSQGNVRSATLRAFNQDEIKRIIAKVS
jgi:uncharacterized protein with GYD domain